MPYSAGGASSNEEAFGASSGPQRQEAVFGSSKQFAAAAPAAAEMTMKAGGAGNCGCGKGACL